MTLTERVLTFLDERIAQAGYKEKKPAPPW
jgi:hypothetical protein